MAKQAKILGVPWYVALLGAGAAYYLLAPKKAAAAEPGAAWRAPMLPTPITSTRAAAADWSINPQDILNRLNINL